VVLLATRGGAYGPGTPKEGWDHSIDYLRRVLAEVWGADLTVVERELTLVGVNPALDQLADLGAAAKETAESAAIAAGRELAARTVTEADAA
jgi:FMN-dependent NADH-azoreductase